MGSETQQWKLLKKHPVVDRMIWSRDETQFIHWNKLYSCNKCEHWCSKRQYQNSYFCELRITFSYLNQLLSGNENKTYFWSERSAWDKRSNLGRPLLLVFFFFYRMFSYDSGIESNFQTFAFCSFFYLSMSCTILDIK